ncbi:MAG: endonuclease III domain-containing protein [Armatimonadota bacterium]
MDALLEVCYGEKRWSGPRDPLDGLIQTILSQNTTDVNSHAAFRSLKQRFPTWEEALRARETTIAKAIQRGGLANIKAGRIKRILRQIKDEHGSLSLDFLHDLPAEEAANRLSQFHGVGRKTVACVLMFDCGKPIIPVDTHVFRVASRLGWLPNKATPERAHDVLQQLVPSELVYQLHLNMVAHGRRLCRPSRPRCDECPLREHCEYVKSPAPSARLD